MISWKDIYENYCEIYFFHEESNYGKSVNSPALHYLGCSRSCVFLALGNKVLFQIFILAPMACKETIVAVMLTLLLDFAGRGLYLDK